MNILHVCKKYPQAMGGDAIVVSSLQKQQQAAGHRTAIVTSNCDEIPEAPHLYKFGLKDTAARLDTVTPRRIVSLVILFFRMFSIVRQERPDTIHTHSIDMAFFASFAARFYGVPVIHTFHIVTFYDASQSALRRKAELWLAKRSHLHTITAPNNYDVQKLRAAGLTQTKILPNGVDTTFWHTNIPGEAHETCTFLAIGRLESQKGYEYLIGAAALLALRAQAPFRIVIVGEGSQKSTLQQRIHALHLDDVITLVGRKSPEEIRALFAQSDVAVFPSLYETTPLTMLEAWAAAIPVIVTQVGIVRDVPADFNAAYVVPSKDANALMQAMVLAMDNIPLRTRIAAKGWDEAQKYTWPHIAQTVEALYRSAW